MPAHRADHRSDRRTRDPEDPADEELEGYHGDTHVVRRRWAWLALALLVGGVVTTGVGVAVPQLVVIAVGVGVLVAGGALAWWSGLFWDVHTAGHTLAEGDEERVVPGSTARRDAPEAQEHAAHVEHRHEEIVADRAATRGNAVRAGGLLLLLAGAWLSLSQWTLYPTEPEARDGTWRAMGGGIIVLMLALRVLVAGRSRLPILIGPPVAVLLVLGGLFLAWTDRAAASEVISGIVVLIGSVLTLDRRRPGPVTRR